MQNRISWRGSDPLSISMVGSGEYVKEKCAKLVDMFENAEDDHEEEMRQEWVESQNEYLKDNDMYIYE